MGRNCASPSKLGFGRRLAVVSSAWLCRIVVRAACNEWLCFRARSIASSSVMRVGKGCAGVGAAACGGAAAPACGLAWAREPGGARTTRIPTAVMACVVPARNFLIIVISPAGSRRDSCRCGPLDYGSRVEARGPSWLSLRVWETPRLEGPGQPHAHARGLADTSRATEREALEERSAKNQGRRQAPRPEEPEAKQRVSAENWKAPLPVALGPGGRGGSRGNARRHSIPGDASHSPRPWQKRAAWREPGRYPGFGTSCARFQSGPETCL